MIAVPSFTPQRWWILYRFALKHDVLNPPEMEGPVPPPKGFQAVWIEHKHKPGFALHQCFIQGQSFFVFHTSALVAHLPVWP